MMEAVSTSETSVISTRPHDAKAQKILNVKNIATYNITAKIQVYLYKWSVQPDTWPNNSPVLSDSRLHDSCKQKLDPSVISMAIGYA
jgi:hypothetical protein